MHPVTEHGRLFPQHRAGQGHLVRSRAVEITGGAAATAGGALAVAAERLVAAPALVADLLGGRSPRRLRVALAVLVDDDGLPAVDPERLRAALRTAAEVLRDAAGVTVLGRPGDPVLVRAPAPPTALRAPCGRGLLRELFGPAGRFYRAHAVPGAVTVFGVVQVVGKAGCAPGPVEPWVLVGRAGLDARADGLTLAHELGHACGLPHLGAGGTLMQPGSRGRRRELRDWQRAVLRSSAHVTRR